MCQIYVHREKPFNETLHCIVLPLVKCSILQCGTVRCSSMLQRICLYTLACQESTAAQTAVSCSSYSKLQWVTVSCNVLRWIAVDYWARHPCHKSHQSYPRGPNPLVTFNECQQTLSLTVTNSSTHYVHSCESSNKAVTHNMYCITLTREISVITFVCTKMCKFWKKRVKTQLLNHCNTLQCNRQARSRNN